MKGSFSLQITVDLEESLQLKDSANKFLFYSTTKTNIYKLNKSKLYGYKS